MEWNGMEWDKWMYKYAKTSFCLLALICHRFLVLALEFEFETMSCIELILVSRSVSLRVRSSSRSARRIGSAVKQQHIGVLKLDGME